ncbi:hypothetical protein YC2023_060727 [Brassica napus]
MLIDMCVLVWLLACTPGMHPDMWEEWWRPACVLDMQPDMWSTRCRRACIRSHAKRHTGCHQPEADWLVSPINTPRPQFISSHPDLSKPTPRDGSVQLNSSRALSSFYDQVEMLSGVSSVLRVHISRSSARYSAGKSDELRGSFQVKISPSRDQSSPLHSSRPLGFGQVLSDQPATSRLEHLQVPVIFKDSVVAGGRTIWSSLGAKPAHARHVLGWTSVSSPSDPKDCGLSRGDPKDCGPRSVLTLSPKVVDIKAMRFPLLEVRLWQEAKSNLVTVALGKDDWIAWCWTLGPPAGPSRAGRVSGRTGRGRGVNFVTLAGSSLTRHVALPDHGVGLDGQSCSCLIVGWPVGLSSPTLGVGRPSVMFLFDCWPVG